jgi:hypothetical protein
VSWLTRRLDLLGAAAAGGFGGIALSQAPAFTQAYLQRLGGHIDEARRTVERIETGAILPWLADDGRDRAAGEIAERVAQLQRLQERLLDAPELLRPLALLRHADWAIARSAADAFTPAVPLSPAALTWTLIGIVLAALTYDALKLPFAAAGRIRQRRATAPGSSKPRRTSGRHPRDDGRSAARKASTTRKAR